jgi:hypothetical protein
VRGRRSGARGGDRPAEEWRSLVGVPAVQTGETSPSRNGGHVSPVRRKRLSAVVAVLGAELDVPLAVLVALVVVDLEREVGQVDGGIGAAEPAGSAGGGGLRMNQRERRWSARSAAPSLVASAGLRSVRGTARRGEGVVTGSSPTGWRALVGVPAVDGGNFPLKKWGACFPGLAARVSAVVAVLVAELDVLLVVLVGVDLEGEVG